MFTYHIFSFERKLEVGNRIVVGVGDKVVKFYGDDFYTDMVAPFKYGFNVKSLKTN